MVTVGRGAGAQKSPSLVARWVSQHFVKSSKVWVFHSWTYRAGQATAGEEIEMNIDLLLVVVGWLLAVPIGIASNLLTSRLTSYLEKRKLIKAHKTRQQALQIYNRIRAFREGRRDKYAYYILLGSSAVILAVAASTIVIVVFIVSPDFPGPVGASSHSVRICDDEHCLVGGYL
jgi:hypothetical protein